MSRDPHLYGATYAFIFDNAGKILLQQRQNTGYYDGGRQVPAGHIDDGETASESIRHECEEELGITIKVNENNVFHIIHRINTERQYMDVGVKITERSGEIINNEPDKCSALERFSLDQLPSYISPSTLQFLQALDENTFYSELRE
ncbi:hypothetical protein XF24_00998 [candidate division SR1 bacterium Aalborg_AAW-1]|nr:hypothetical protein XF24_00998 [candidate division SR1 bacterium Aalborg_AAW-1]